MSSDQSPSERSAEFRRALVATANLAPYVRRRPPFRLVVAGFAAFVLAGALTGGAIATASKPDPKLVAAQAAASTIAQDSVTTEYGTLIGRSFLRSASGTQTIDVGEKPAGATALVEGFGCLDDGHFVLFLDSKKVDSFEDCSPGGSGSNFLTVSGAGNHLVSLSTQKAVRYAVWLSWAHIPLLTDSAAQQQEMADGVVSREEDLAAFYRFEGCMTALGHPLTRITTGLVPGYSEDAAALSAGADNRCYWTEYRQVDAQWQIEISEGKVGVASADACPSPDQSVPSASPQREIMTKGGVLPILTGCPWVG
jgi:hypothetical protein